LEKKTQEKLCTGKKRLRKRRFGREFYIRIEIKSSNLRMHREKITEGAAKFAGCNAWTIPDQGEI